MTATDELRRLLDERRVEHYDGTESTLWLKDEHGYRASADELTSGRLSVHIWCDTPAQAIAATLGSDRLAFLEEKVRLQGDYIIKLTKEYDALFAQSCEAATRHAGQIDAMQRKLEAATLGAGTCEADETDLIPFVRADSGDLDVDYIHVMECSACGGTYEHVNGGYEFCPRCGARVVEVDE